MKVSEGLRFVVGSITVYVIMAACAGGASGPVGFGPDQGAGGSSSGGDGSGSSGAMGSSGSASDGSGGPSFLDALTDPVPAAQADANQSGSRLKAKWLVGADGSKQWNGWHDSMLNVDCSYLPASDGTTRCMPSGYTSVGSTFSDAGCTNPLAQVIKSTCASSPSSYVLQGVTTACMTAYRMFQLGQAYSGPLYSGTPANCLAEPDASADSLRSAFAFYALGSELAPSMFVAATVQTDP